MSDKTIKAQQNGHEVRGFIESQGIIISRDGDRVTCDIDDLIGVALTLCAYERSLERERCAKIADKAAGPFGGVGLIKVASDIAADIRKGEQE